MAADMANCHAMKPKKVRNGERFYTPHHFFCQSQGAYAFETQGPIADSQQLDQDPHPEHLLRALR